MELERHVNGKAIQSTAIEKRRDSSDRVPMDHHSVPCRLCNDDDVSSVPPARRGYFEILYPLSTRSHAHTVTVPPSVGLVALEPNPNPNPNPNLTHTKWGARRFQALSADSCIRHYAT